MLLPMPLQPLLLTILSGFTTSTKNYVLLSEGVGKKKQVCCGLNKRRMFRKLLWLKLNLNVCIIRGRYYSRCTVLEYHRKAPHFDSDSFCQHF